MINDNRGKNMKPTYTINLTHIATSYPHSIDIDSDTYKTIFKARSTSDAIGNNQGPFGVLFLGSKKEGGG